MNVYLFTAHIKSRQNDVPLTRRFGVMGKTHHQAYLKAMRGALRRYRSYYGNYSKPESIDLQLDTTYPLDGLES